MTRIRKLNIIRYRRKLRARSRIFGTSGKPRLSIFRSNRYLYAQVIDDERGETLASASTKSLSIKKTVKAQAALELGKSLAESVKKLGVKQLVLDKSRYKYHGRIKAMAEGLRESGIKI